MWTVLMFLYLGALYFTVASSPPSPVNVIFSSVNLRNTLHWIPGNGTPDDTHFTVQYAIYGDSVEDSKGRRVNWRAVRRCTEIVRSWCDLSNETWDLEQGYYARVRAVSRRTSSKWALTWRFDPKSDTSFGPPLVSVDIDNNTAIITLKGPMMYQPNNQTPVVSMAALYPQMTYNLSINNIGRAQMSHILVVSGPYKYRLMEYNTEYCFSAKAKFHSMPIPCQPSAWQCMTTPPDPVIGQLQRVVVGIVVTSGCMCMLLVVGYLLYHYVTGTGQKTPYILNRPSFKLPPLTSPRENLNFSTVIKPSDIKGGTSEPACTNQQHIADPPPGYTPQRSETYPQPDGPWDDESIDYGFLVTAPRISVREEEEERERRHDGGDDGNNKDEKQTRRSGDTNEKEGWRVEDGCFTGVCAPQAKPYLSHTSSHTCPQTHTRRERSTLTQAHACSRVNSAASIQAQAPLLSFQGGELQREEEGKEFPGLFMNQAPQFGFFHIPLNLRTKKESGTGVEMDRKVRGRAGGKIDGGVEVERGSERVPLFSYASQNIADMSIFHADQSDFLPVDYGVLRLATGDEVEKDEEEEEGTTCIDWDPETRKLVLPELAMEFTKEEGLDELMHGGRGRENRVGGEEEEEEEEVNAMKDELTLKSVYVREASEEEANAERGVERGGERQWEADDILTKWDLVISMDQ
ncbi:interleukin-20 receptor subunit alpha [Chaetodon trifascialis]|uniref:interleukin-20 receptor subunit alpha n=1 Tax=Chaetodon trifascialis TaxID=109706 RepID=UPI003992126A